MVMVDDEKKDKDTRDLSLCLASAALAALSVVAVACILCYQPVTHGVLKAEIKSESVALQACNLQGSESLRPVTFFGSSACVVLET